MVADEIARDLDTAETQAAECKVEPLRVSIGRIEGKLPRLVDYGDGVCRDGTNKGSSTHRLDELKKKLEAIDLAARDGKTRLAALD